MLILVENLIFFKKTIKIVLGEIPIHIYKNLIK